MHWAISIAKVVYFGPTRTARCCATSWKDPQGHRLIFWAARPVGSITTNLIWVFLRQCGPPYLIGSMPVLCAVCFWVVIVIFLCGSCRRCICFARCTSFEWIYIIISPFLCRNINIRLSRLDPASSASRSRSSSYARLSCCLIGLLFVSREFWAGCRAGKAWHRRSVDWRKGLGLLRWG